MSSAGDRPKLRILFYSKWAQGLHDAQEYLNALPARDLTNFVTNASDPELIRTARLDCDWDGECLRAFSSMKSARLDFSPAQMVGPLGLVDLIASSFPKDEVFWLFFIGQRPATIDSAIQKILEIFTSKGGKIFYWSFDEASRSMKCFSEIAPYLSVLIHDEFPLEENATKKLPKSCKIFHHSWVANVLPESIPFEVEVKKRIIFLGSKIGLTLERKKQIETLQNHFKDKFMGIFDHSVPVSERSRFSKIKVHWCPEGRMFKTQAMSQSHTDRPFWAGCMGQVPIVENSEQGNRLENLFRNKLIYRYTHNHEAELISACEEALEASDESRKEIYQYFNQYETVGIIAAKLLEEYHR
jgi:hypothetical protein